MKKTYITPKAIGIDLNSESLMIGNSIELKPEGNGGEVDSEDDVWTRGQNPIWDTWQ